MRKIGSALVERFGLVVIAGGFTALLHFFGELGFSASIFLGITLTIIGMWLYGLVQLAGFKPYRLIVGVKYDALWEDLKLSPADGPKFENFTLTAISPAVFARSDDRQYSARLDIYQDVPCGAPAWRSGPGEITDVPTFFLRPHPDGYQFGVHVQEEWWKQHSLQLNDRLRTRPLAYDHTIVLGLLPYGYIPDYARQWNEPITFFRGFERKQSRWKKRLEQEGWAVDINDPTYLTHRYLAIAYHDI
jgi:hypothetical protein